MKDVLPFDRSKKIIKTDWDYVQVKAWQGSVNNHSEEWARAVDQAYAKLNQALPDIPEYKVVTPAVILPTPIGAKHRRAMDPPSAHKKIAAYIKEEPNFSTPVKRKLPFTESF